MGELGKHRDKFSEPFSAWNFYEIRDEWVPIVDEALDEILEIDPDVKIHQIKEKFGDLRLYISPALDPRIRAIVLDAEIKCREQRNQGD